MAAVVLAAGAGSRFEGGTHKLRAPVGGRPLAAHALEAAAASGLPLIVVTGAVDLADLVPHGATVVHNPRWAEGQATSLAVGITAARAGGFDAVVVGLADQPGIPPEAWRKVAAVDAPVAVATYDGRRRNPVRLSREVWDLLPTTGDEGARVLMRTHPGLVTEVPCPGDPTDIDTAADLRAWWARRGGSGPAKRVDGTG